uniref:VWFC domain-containing protein n=1 Tax=Cacopsylla melanoneura TaxID=428564 RepID=A0A8D8UBU4_9HEMI
MASLRVFVCLGAMLLSVAMVCAAGDITYDADGCVSEGVRHKYGDTFYDGCVGICSCTRDGAITCVSRCPPSVYMYTASSRNCREVPDPNDSCCRVTVCDEDEPIQVFIKASEATTSAANPAA